MSRTLVAAGIVTLFIVFTIVNSTAQDSAPRKKPFIVLDKELVFNLEKGGGEDGKLTIYGLTNGTKLDIFSSNLVDESTGAIIASSNITFNSQSNFALNINAGQIMHVTFSAKAPESGVYSGDIILSDGTSITTIPITISTNPKYLEATLLVLAGIGMSILLWSIASYFALVHEFNSLRERIKHMNDSVTYYQKFSSNKFDLFLTIMKSHLNEFIEYMTLSQISLAQERLDEADEVFDQMKSPENLDQNKLNTAARVRNLTLDQYVSVLLKTQRRYSSKTVVNEMKPEGPLKDFLIRLRDQNTNSDKGFSIWGYLTAKKMRINFILSTIAAIAGVVVSYSVVFQQDYVNSLREIGIIDVIILIGIGLGIDNIKQLVARYIDR